MIRQQTSKTRSICFFGATHNARTISEQYATEDAVLASEIEQLPDLARILKFVSRPEWLRVVLTFAKK